MAKEQFKYTDWSQVPDLLLIYIFIHDEPTIGKSRTEQTKEEYLRDLMQFYNFACEYRGMRCLHPSDVLLYQIQLSEKRKPTTVRRKISVIKQFLRYIYRRKIISTDLISELKHVAQPSELLINRDFYEHEVTALLLHLKKTDFFIYTLLHILVSTGMRIRELANAKWDDMHFEPSIGRTFLNILGKGNKPREIMIFDNVYVTITEFRKRRGLHSSLELSDTKTAFFAKPNGTSYHEKYLSQLFSESIATAPFPFIQYRKQRITPHTCRHFTAVNFLRHGADLKSIQEALGHSTLRTTERYLRRNQLLEHHAGLKIGSTFTTPI